MAFINATRQNIRKVGQLKYASAQRSSLDLPRTGLLANLFIRVKGTMTVTKGTGTATFKTDNYNKPFNLIDRIKVTANSGTEIVNVTAMGLMIRNMISESSVMDMAGSTLPSAVSASPVYKFGTNEGANPVEFTIKVPIQVNDRDNIGMILLQNGETLITVGLDWANVSNLFTLTGNATVAFDGDAHISMEYYSVPANREDYPDLSIAHTMLEDKSDIDGTGDKTYTIPRGNIYQRIIHRVMLNGVPAGFDDVDKLKMVYNQSETPYELESHDIYALQRSRYKRDLPQAVFVYDFSYQGLAGLGGNRDLVNSKAITDFNSIIQIATNATLGSNNNSLLTFREQLVPLA
ncbi:hypothetical protein phiG2_13 [Lysinibacillus phage phiG2]|nr:hypothetical protein phiG2_13 [Lysinibacillus phage phiG2]